MFFNFKSLTKLVINVFTFSVVGKWVCVGIRSFNSVLASGLIATLTAVQVHAYLIEFKDPEMAGFINTTATASIAMRTRNYAVGNGSGNRSIFDDRGDIYSSPLSLLSDISLTKGNYGVFTRLSYIYDYTVQNQDCSNCFRPTPQGRANGISGKAQDKAGNNFQVLDMFVYGKWDLDGRAANLRVGKQVINWGESDILGGGISQMQNPVDLGKTTVPGTEVKETLMPQELVYGSFDVAEGLSFETYYVWNWRESTFIPVGTLFSPADIFGDGYHPDLAPGIAFAGKLHEPQGGQWGFAVHKIIDSWNGADFGAYWVRSHAFTPYIVYSPGATHPLYGPADVQRGGYQWAYAEDQDTFALSLSGEIPGNAGIAFQTELNYKPNLYDTRQCRNGFGLIPGSHISGKDGTPVFDGCGIGNSNVLTYLGGVIKNYGGDYFGANKMNLIANVQAQWIDNLQGGDPTDLKNIRGRFQGVSALDGPITDFSWGYLGLAALEYNDVFWGLNVLPTVVWIHNVEGYQPGAAGSLVEKQRTIRGSVQFTYLSVASLEVAYSHWLGERGSNYDKDNVALIFKYNF